MSVAASITESRVLSHSLDQVWKWIRPMNFKFWSAVTSVDVESGGLDAGLLQLWN